MAFHFVHNLIEKIKEAYNRPYIESAPQPPKHKKTNM